MADRTNILLKEYETCQSHNNHIGSQVWVSTTIFLTINVTLLGGLFYTLITKIVFRNSGLGEINLITLGLVLVGVTALGAGIIWILKKWIDWLKRMRCRTSVNFERIKQIERILGMRRHLMCRLIDEKFKKMSPNIQRKFLKNNKFKYSPAGGFDGLICIAKILIGVWSFSLLVLWAVAIISLFDC